jgi:hypothetical protein
MTISFPLRKRGIKGDLIMTAEVQGGIKNGIDPTRIARQFFSYSPRQRKIEWDFFVIADVQNTNDKIVQFSFPL